MEPILSLNDLLLYFQILNTNGILSVQMSIEIPYVIYKYVFANRMTIRGHRELSELISKYEDLNRLRCLPENYKQSHFYLQNYALENYIKNMKVLLDDGYSYWNEKIYYYAINGPNYNDGNLNCLKFLLENNCPWDHPCEISRRIHGDYHTFIYLNITDIAAHCGNLECLTYLYDEGHIISGDTFYHALDGLNEEEYHSKKQFKIFKKNIIDCIEFLYGVG